MARPKPIAVSYDPDVDDSRILCDETVGIAGGRGMHNAFPIRALEWLAFGTIFGGQIATAIVFNAVYALAAPLRVSGSVTYGLFRGAFALLGPVSDTIAQCCAVAGTVLILTTLREAFSARSENLVRYVPLAGAVISLTLIVVATRVRYATYFGRYSDLLTTLHTLMVITYAQIAALLCAAVTLAWMQNSHAGFARTPAAE